MIIGAVPAALTLILRHGLPVGNIALSASISALFALFAWLLGGVNASGALAGFAIAFTLYMGGDWQMFAVLFLVFVLTWMATRAGHAKRPARGLAEGESGAESGVKSGAESGTKTGRNAAQVVANVGLAAWAVTLPARWPGLALLATCAAVAVLAEAAADTCSSELGKAYGGKTVLITTGHAVSPGTDGGVSAVGTASSLLAALLVAGSAAALGVLALRSAVVVVLAGVLGATLDSLLGATLERRGEVRKWRLNNDSVNLLGTAAAGTLAACLCAALLYKS